MTERIGEKRREGEVSILYQYTIPKTKQLVLKPKPDGSWDVEISAFRELHLRNHIPISATLMEKAVRPFLREHNWPPGNSQTLLQQFQENQSKKGLVCACGRKATRKSTLNNGQVVWSCSLHSPAKERVRMWKPIK